MRIMQTMIEHPRSVATPRVTPEAALQPMSHDDVQALLPHLN
ncbi:hypothetical protein [Bradyrhizobium sp. B120]